MSIPQGTASPHVHLRLRGALVGHRRDAPLFPPFDFELCAGEWLLVAGPNGSGKSSFVLSLMGALPLVGGVREVGTPGLRFGYVPQRPSLDPIWPLSTLDVVRMGGAPWHRPFRRDASLTHRSLELLDEVGLGGLADRPFRALSGGQKQRALIARALVGGAEVLVLDEPANHLDPIGERALLDTVAALHAKHRPSIVWISHRLDGLLHRADRIAFLDPSGVRVGPPDRLRTEGVLDAFLGEGAA